MRAYEQRPTGWWQDSSGRMQPPGSFSDATLRVPAERPGARPGSSGTWLRRLLAALNLT
jgi:hypothetical protein